MSPTPIAELEAALAAAPFDENLRARLALALTDAGDHAAAAGVLGQHLRNLSAHDGPTLPCLCKRCLKPELARAEAEGMSFDRRFAVAQGRVLYYWVPSEMADDRSLARAVASRLGAKLTPA